MRFFKTALPIISLSLLFACGNDEDNMSSYNRWDQDRDDRMDQEEFSNYWNDENFQADWDKNNDGVVESEEWDSSYNEFYSSQGDAGEHSFEAWDQNGDGFVDKNEMTAGTFSFWDSDGNGKIDHEEYNEYKYRK